MYSAARIVKPRRDGLQQIEAALTAAQDAYAAAQATGDWEGLSGAGRDLRYWTARRSTANRTAMPRQAPLRVGLMPSVPKFKT
jgi:hypothetical protein